MNRLTIKECNIYEESVFSLINCDTIYKKLKRLEDIEEELGIYLFTLFNVLKEGFYFKYKDKIINSNDYICEIRVNLRGNWVCDIMSSRLDYILFSIKFKDYGKTWALTSEELENEVLNDGYDKN